MTSSEKEHKETFDKAKLAISLGQYQNARELLIIIIKAEETAALAAKELKEDALKIENNRLISAANLTAEIAESYLIEFNYQAAANYYINASNYVEHIDTQFLERESTYTDYLNQAGLAYHALGQYDKAIGYFEQALKSDLITFGEDHPDVAVSRNNLGLAYHALGQYDKAIGYYEQALKSLLITFDEDHPTVVVVRKNLEGVYSSLVVE